MKKAKYIVIFIVFNVLLALTLVSLNYVMRNKEYEGAQDLFKDWAPEHADIVFIGNSHQFCSIDPELLYNEYGIESFMLSTSSQTVPMSYYAAMEAIELHKPDTIVMEVAYTANDFRTLAGMDHCFFDGFPRCEARRLALEDLIPKEERIYYLIPLGIFHSRWKELSIKDFQGFPLSYRGGVHFENIDPNWEIEIIDKSETKPMPEEMEKYMDKLVDLCNESGVRLILYTAPFNGLYCEEYSTQDLKEREKVFNYIYEYAAGKGVEYHNMFYELDKLNINSNTDWMDSQHLNCYGQEKFTRYMVESGYLGY